MAYVLLDEGPTVAVPECQALRNETLKASDGPDAALWNDIRPKSRQAVPILLAVTLADELLNDEELR